jgi:hypothetical protein
MTAARDCALSAAVPGGQAGYRLAGGPWWAEADDVPTRGQEPRRQ